MAMLHTTTLLTKRRMLWGIVLLWNFVLLLCPTLLWAQPKLLSQQNLAKWHIKPANYSGITMIDDTTYAVVDDKSETDGFYLFNIRLNPKTGKIEKVSSSNLIAKKPTSNEEAAKRKKADCEDIVYMPHTRTLFISLEGEAEVKEYDIEGIATGRSLLIPTHFAKPYQNGNGGFEALAYNDRSKTFWLTTENPLTSEPAFVDKQGVSHQPLRIINFGESLKPQSEWAYLMSPAQLSKDVKYYAHGVSALIALPDGKLLVMERELSIPNHYLGGKCRITIFSVSPNDNNRIGNSGTSFYQSSLANIDENRFLEKQEVCSFTTNIKIGSLNYANYEGMCLGPRLKDGRQTLILINDSQAGAGNSFYTLKDYLKVIILD